MVNANLLTNSDFATGDFTNWLLNYGSDPVTDNTELTITVENHLQGVNLNNFNFISNTPNLGLSNGDFCELKFTVYANSDTTKIVKLSTTGMFGSIDLNTRQTLTGSPSGIQYTFSNIEVTDADALFKIGFEDSTNWTIEIADIQLIKTEYSAPRAFPTARGHGANATGGRYKNFKVVVDNASGSSGSDVDGQRTARYANSALTSNEGGVVVFLIGGTWNLGELNIQWPENTTILAQSAPFDSGGVTFTNCKNSFKNNTIVRYVRFYRGDNGEADKNNHDSVAVEDSGSIISNVIFDHCTFGLAIDGAMDAFYRIANVTFQNCYFLWQLNDAGHPKGNHSLSTLIGGDGGQTGPITWLNCMWTGNQGRNPFNKQNSDGEMIGNLVVGWGYGGNVWGAGLRIGTDSSTRWNILDNFSLAIDGETYPLRNGLMLGGAGSGSATIFVSGNINSLRTSYSQPETDAITTIYTTPGSYVTESVMLSDVDSGAYDELPSDRKGVTSNVYTYITTFGGCYYPGRVQRDSIGTEALSRIAAGTISVIDNQSEVGGIPNNAAGTPMTDTDRDGLPDDWQAQNVPTGSISTDIAPSGYQYLEEYNNDLVSENYIIDETPPPVTPTSTFGIGVWNSARTTRVTANIPEANISTTGVLVLAWSGTPYTETEAYPLSKISDGLGWGVQYVSSIPDYRFITGTPIESNATTFGVGSLTNTFHRAILKWDNSTGVATLNINNLTDYVINITPNIDTSSNALVGYGCRDANSSSVRNWYGLLGDFIIATENFTPADDSNYNGFRQYVPSSCVVSVPTSINLTDYSGTSENLTSLNFTFTTHPDPLPTWEGESEPPTPSEPVTRSSYIYSDSVTTIFSDSVTTIWMGPDTELSGIVPNPTITVNLVENSTFDTWSDGDVFSVGDAGFDNGWTNTSEWDWVPSGWTVDNPDASQYITENVGSDMRVISDWSFLNISTDNILNTNDVHRMEFDITLYTQGKLRMDYDGWHDMPTEGTGNTTVRIQNAGGDDIRLGVGDNTDCDFTFGWIQAVIIEDENPTSWNYTPHTSSTYVDKFRSNIAEAHMVDSSIWQDDILVISVDHNYSMEITSANAGALVTLFNGDDVLATGNTVSTLSGSFTSTSTNITITISGDATIDNVSVYEN